ncbi:MAG TPA: hypothetical protein V6C89_12095 [Drouetiella sp.]|jgi:hypothetical protein
MMNTPALTKCLDFKKALAAILPAMALMIGTATASIAAPNDLATNATGPIDDVNPDTAYNIRVNYGKRFPFMQAAWQSDTLEKILNGQSNGDTGDGNGRTNGAGRNQTTGAATAGSGTGNQAGGNEANIKKSKLTTEKDAVQVLAYDIMVKPFGQPGHYLPGADPLHQPQYASQGDSLVQYAQPKMMAMDQPKTMRDLELFQNCLTTFGLPCSDTQYQMIDRENNQRMLELAFDPERFYWASTIQGQLQTASLANVLAGSSEAAFKQATARIVQADGGGGNGAGGGAGGAGGAPVGALINIANEQSGVPTAADNPYKTVPQAVWMVQQMYKFVFVPLAILFLLPGAVITQVKSQIVQGFKLNAEDQSSPFEGILRSVIAVFLIPATQLIVSYSIDVGNSMAYSVKDWVDLQLIFDWSRELTYNTPIDKNANTINATGNAAAANNGGNGGQAGGQSGGFLGSISGFLGSIPLVGGALQSGFNSLAGFLGASGEGLGSDTPEQNTVYEDQSWLSGAMEAAFNMATYLFSSAVIVLGAYQLTFMCYLFLLGPLAAAFFAWPRIQAQSQQKLFTDVFANWVNAVIVVSLWRFYWMVILAIMTQRILYIQDSGGASNLQWEVAVFTCLLGLMMWVPFNPWSFDPAAAFETANATGQQMMKGASGAMGSAAQAGGMPAGQVQAMQGQINQALQPMQQVSSAFALASNGPSGTGSGLYQGTGAMAGMTEPANSGGATNANMSANVTPPPSANFSNTSPATNAPVSSVAQPTTSQPPTLASPAANNANLAVAQNANPEMPVSAMPESTPLSPSNGATMAVNTNASTGDVQNAMPEAQTTMASLGVEGGGAPLTGNGGNGGGNDGGGSANMVAMSGPPTSGGADQGGYHGQSGGSTNSGGSNSGDSSIQVATLAAASSSGGTNSGGTRNNPPNETPPPQGNNDQNTPPPPTAYA